MRNEKSPVAGGRCADAKKAQYGLSATKTGAVSLFSDRVAAFLWSAALHAMMRDRDGKERVVHDKVICFDNNLAVKIHSSRKVGEKKHMLVDLLLI